MTEHITRRAFLSKSSSGIGAGVAAALLAREAAGATGSRKGPHDFTIVRGHLDIWEFNDRFRLTPDAETAPLRDHLLPRLIEGGVDVAIIPAGGDSVPERGGRDRLFMGSMSVVDMLLTEIEKTDGKASLILKKSDIPTGPCSVARPGSFWIWRAARPSRSIPSQPTTRTDGWPSCGIFTGWAFAGCS